MNDAPVSLERRGHAAFITLNRPRAINALTHEMVGFIQAALEACREDVAVRTVVLLGAGERGLCAGGDLVSIFRDAVCGGNASEAFWRDEYYLNATIARYPKPYVAVMDGLVLGGGVGLSAHGSHRVVTERTSLGMPETGIGFLPDVGATWLLAHAPGELGTFLALTADQVGPGDAIVLGLADRYVPSSELPTLLELLAIVPADEALAVMSQRAPTSILAAQQHWIDTTFDRGDVGAILAALRKSHEPAAKEAHASTMKRSPTSLVVSLQALRQAREVSCLDEALRQELRIAVRLLRSHDLREGIRAQVIDKDRKPCWRPATLEAVTPSDVAELFAPLPDELCLPPEWASTSDPSSTTAGCWSGAASRSTHRPRRTK